MKHSEILASVDNQAATSHYYPDSNGLVMGDHTVVTFGFAVSGGVTVTVEACFRRLDTADTTERQLSDTWVDITKMGIDGATGAGGTASWVDTNGVVQFNGLAVERIRLKCVCSDTSNSIDAWVKRF